MTTIPKILGSLIGLLAITQTGCAGLGIAMVGAGGNGNPLDTAALLDPSIPTIGEPTQAGNGTVTLSVNLPEASAYRTQYGTQDITRVAIGLVDLNNSDTTKLYFGSDDVGALNSSSYLPLMGDTLLNWPYTNSPGTDVLKRNFNRYLYHNLTANMTPNINPTTKVSSRTVGFTNIKPGTRVFGFAVAFVNNGVTSVDVAGVGQTANALSVVAGTNTLDPINVSLDRNMGKIDGTVTITPSKPTASTP